MVDHYASHFPTPKHVTLSEVNDRDALETWRGMASAQEKALRALIKEIDSIALFMSEKTGAVTEAFQTLAPSEVEGVCASQGQVNALIQNLQFQDQANQRLEHVKDTLIVIADTLKELDNQTKNRIPSLNPHPSVDMQWLHEVICRYTLRDARERFVQSLLSEGLLPEEMAQQEQNNHDGLAKEDLADGDIEIF